MKSIPSTVLILLVALVAGCAGTLNAAGESYHEPVLPGRTKLLNWTGSASTAGAAEVYFEASSRKEMLVTFRDRLIVYAVDGVTLPGAKVGNGASGYQAIALAPGVHSISYCHTTRSDLATGAVMCSFEIKNFEFEAGAQYMISENVSVKSIPVGTGASQQLTVRTRLHKLN